jgi:subtilase family serine protease
MNANLVPVHGSKPLLGGMLIGYPNPSKETDFVLTLRSKVIPPQKAAELNNLILNPPHLRKYLTHDELEEISGADPADVEVIETYFKKYGIRIKNKNLLTRTLTLTSDIHSIEKAFHSEVAIFEGVDRHSYLSNITDHLLPSDINNIVNKVKTFSHPVKIEFRLPTRPIKDSLKTTAFRSPLSHTTADTAAIQQGYSAIELATAYKFPEGATGTGQVIGIIELGGKLNPSDFQQYFSQMNLKAPEIIEVGTPPVITGQTEILDNAEVTLDLEVIGAIAPNTKLIVYYGNTIAEAMKEVIGDTINKPSVVSISWAGSEYDYSPKDIEEMNLLFYQASLLGITIVAASADHGALNNKGFPNVSLPSSSPLILGCGGTIVSLSNDEITSQVVWNELNGQVGSGGGYSSLYPLPSYQYQAIYRYPFQKSNMRGVPDIAADASMINGYQVVFNGKNTVIGGTSASTPFVAVLIALLNEKLGYRLGFVNSLLYGLAGTSAFNQIVAGNNQVYTAAPFWNPCTGLGGPIGDKLLAFFEALQNAKL